MIPLAILWMVVTWGRQLFSGALSVALPGMTALLVVNLGFGVMSRAAPTLNLFAVGFDDGSFGIWNSESKKQLFEVSDHGAPVIAVTWSQGGNELATVDKTGRVRVWAEPTRFDLRGEGVTFQKAQ